MPPSADFFFLKNQGRARRPWLVLGFITCAVVLVTWGFFIEPGRLVDRKLQHDGWPGKELKIAFFSDLHAGSPHIDRGYIERLVARINAESPDIILIGGDFIINGITGGEPIPIEEVASLLHKLTAPLGVFAVLGNHDWWGGGAAIAAALRTNGIELLENQAKLIERPDEDKFWLIGIGDAFTGHSDGIQAFIATDRSWPKIAFMHDPAAIFEIKEHFNVAFAGHLHGGQIFVPGIGAIVTPGRAPRSWAQKEWIDFELGSLFVSNGIGTSILPVRFNAPPEYVMVKLKS